MRLLNHVVQESWIKSQFRAFKDLIHETDRFLTDAR